MEAFARFSGDRNPLHFDPGFAAGTRAERQEWDYPAPVYIGDTVTAEAEVIESRADKPITRLRCVARRQDGVEVLRGECLVYTMLPDGPVAAGG